VSKEELGLKRVCASCGTKFYDLNRDPIICPKCGAVYSEDAAATPAPVKAVKPEQPEETEQTTPEGEVNLDDDNTVSFDELIEDEAEEDTDTDDADMDNFDDGDFNENIDEDLDENLDEDLDDGDDITLLEEDD